ncbi:MAG: threonine--tRNA ligase [Chloroflexi bacterium GWB2_49_20]|nr:MAG: threonine--tRNA ligase [Chloroflexi bacterium GWB2_49_20]OGN80425.1 MAG: threonine--tRNA ligase [Chloroflexi bacterium GWC2_49_37]OGN84249.1 MAG: threonine--tRNA ligase [Chloroflexi bacterium GWD2_49_16]
MAEKIQERYEDSDLYRIRHSTAHVMAQAVLEMFPEAKYTIGPPIENGFYYDFDLPRPLTPDDLKALEKRMRQVLAGRHVFQKKVISADEARQVFAQQPYKLELIAGLEQGGFDEYGNPLKEKPDISIYSHDKFVDLCRGPHVENTGQINPAAVKLMSVAGAYWRGDEKNAMLQRIYGTAWRTPKELEEYLWQLEEAKKRDHRRLGKELGLFHFSDDVGPGLPLFTPKGEMLRHLMETYVRDLQTRYGYSHVWTGHLVKEDLYKRSGHYDNYVDSMFPPMVDENITFRLKPMNCPSHMTLYKEMGRHSYRELPMRFGEFATLYRYEKTGELTGLTRVRALTQDDCHIFCTEDQIQQEFTLALKLIQEVLERYRFIDYKVRLSLRGEGGKYVQDDEKWAKAETALRASLDANNVEYFEASGEAAFYGPKADFLARDVLGREWQLSTIQVDFIQPARLGLIYIAEDGAEHTPVVLHRAVTGTTERFMGVIIEHFAGAFPVWLAPQQVMIIPIADRHLEYSGQVAEKLKAAGLRVEVDGRTERMNSKIRDAQKQKIPYMLVIGDQEAEAGQVALRLRSGDNPGAMSLADFISLAQKDIQQGN